MKLILQFLKPHWKLTVLTVLLAVTDVGGSMFIPTLAAHLLNQGTSGVAFEELLTTGLQMGVISLFSSICAILGGYACATLAARIGKDMRVALYEKSLKLSVYDFRQFGTASITTEPFRTSPPSSLRSPASSRWCCRYRWSASSPWRCPSS